MTLFLRTGAVRTRLYSIIGAVWVVTALLAASLPASAATLADLAGPLRDVAALDAVGALTPNTVAARVAGVRNGRVLVQVLFRSPASVNGGAVGRLGGQIHQIRDRRMEVVVPVGSLRDIALLPSVAQVAVPAFMTPLQTGPTVTEGLQITNGLSMQINGNLGTGVRVAVIDVGFQDYATAELPLATQTRLPMSFRADGLVEFRDHGTAVAEVIADMAPGADIYLLAIATSMDVERALDWCVANDMEIANLSIGLETGPFDGTHSVDVVVDRTRAAGVLPIVSAGNHAEKHWAGDFLDGDADGFAEFDASDETISVTIPAASTNLTILAYLSWFQTAGPTGLRADVTNRDYDLVLTDATGTVVAQSAVTQNGDDPPTEVLQANVTTGVYEIKLLAVSPNIVGGPVDAMQLFVRTHDIEPALNVPETSVLIPGTARGAMTVAATRGNASLGSPTTIPDFPVDTLEAFSSQGPTIDGRTKPEIAAPDAVMVAVATANPVASPFFGTSAAAPHVAGGAALLKGEDTTRTADELENVLLRLATDQNIIAPITRQDGTPATVAEAGVGRLTLRSGLDTKPPTIVFSFPLNGSTITTAQPTIVAVITDTETGVDPSTIVLAIDGTTVMWDSFNPTTGVVTYRPVTPLSRAAHTATLDAADIAGNVGVQGITNFRVGLPTLSAGLHMISLPFRNLLDANPASIFGVGVNELGLVRWVPTDTAFNKYRIFPDPLASFEPPDATGVSNPTVPSPPAGLGYFLNLPREVILNVAGETLSDVPSYTIQLPVGVTDPTGWHMIGNPFQDTVDWSTVQFQSGNVRLDLDDAIAAGWTEGIIFEYIPAAGALAGRYEFVQPLAAILESMKGYWFHVNRDLTAVIYPSSVGTAEAAAKSRAKATEPTADDWKLQLVATAGGMVDSANYLGVAPGSSDGHDCGGDIPEPPPLGDQLRVYFPHNDWDRSSGQYTQDLRAPSASRVEWDMDVVCPVAKTDVILSWPNLNGSIDPNLNVWIVDEDTGRAQFMRTTSSLAYNSGTAPAHHFKIVAQVADATAGLQVTTLEAHPVRGGQVVINYELTTAASITAEIRNIAGRHVRSLVASRDVDAGPQTLTWTGTSDQGSAVPNGTYLLHLSAKAPDGQAVKRILPIHATR